MTVSPLTPRRGRPMLWAYGYEDVAALLGLTVPALRHRAHRGQFDPGNLEAVCRAWAANQVS